MALPLIFVVLLVGLLIGGVGIGGVLLVPALKYLGQIPLHTAIPACMVGYIATGFIGSIVFGRQGSINWQMALKVCLGALPGAFMGAWVLQSVSASVLEAAIALLLVFSGVNALKKAPQVSSAAEVVSGQFLVISGLITGIGSALTGTGGPLLLIPILLFKRVHLLTAIGLAQVIQIPISFTATLGNFISGSVDFRLGLLLGFLLALGSFAGAKLVHALPLTAVKKSVAVLMVLVGISMFARMLLGFDTSNI